jgi:hypothetical protein
MGMMTGNPGQLVRFHPESPVAGQDETTPG